MSLYKLPKFVYEVPVLNSSRAIVVNNILSDELESNYKPLSRFFKLLKYPEMLFSLFFGAFLFFLLFLAVMPIKSFGISLLILFMPTFIALIFTIFAVSSVRTTIWNKLILDAVPARDQAVVNWIASRYGVNVSSDVAAKLVYEFKSEDNKLVRVNNSLVRFQTVAGEGELLFDSAGNEWKVPVTV